MGLRVYRNRFTTRAGVDYPIIQGPLGGLPSQRLTAAVSNFGGLGSFGAHGLEPAAIQAQRGAFAQRHERPRPVRPQRAVAERQRPAWIVLLRARDEIEACAR